MTADLTHAAKFAALAAAPPDVAGGAGGAGLDLSPYVDKLIYAVPLAGVLALLYAWWRARWIARQPDGTDEMREIAAAIAEGALAFLKRQYVVLGAFVVVVAALLAFLNYETGGGEAGTKRGSALIAVSFVVGALCSAGAGFIGMRTATKANVRTTHAARTGIGPALQVAFSGGLVMGLCVVGLGVLGLSGLFIAYEQLLSGTSASYAQDVERIIGVLGGFSLGASSIALFARVGGGIYTKAADVGADLAGKVYEGIPEDDPRNPATIADNVGDNVGDVAGMGADLFESYVGSIVGTMVLGAAFIPVFTQSHTYPIAAVVLPLVIAAVGIVVSILGSLLVRVKEGGDPQKGLNLGEFGSAAAMAGLSYFIITAMLPDEWVADDPISGRLVGYTAQGVYAAVVIGLSAGVLIGLITEYYCSTKNTPTYNIAKQSMTGSATNIISGLGVGMYSTGLPTLVLAGAIVGASHFAGLYGIAVAAVGMLSVMGIQLAVDAYGPISDNAGGIAEMAHLPPEVRERTDTLDAVGNTTAAIGKGFAIGSAALTALALFAAYLQQVNAGRVGDERVTLDIAEPIVMAGLFVGGCLPFVFSAMAMNAVGRAAGDMIHEVGRQFRDIPGLREGTAKADYARCVDISTKAAIREMILPGVLAVAAPVVVGLISPSMLGGLLAGVTVSGVLMAIFQSNAGGAWDNAKKRIEGGIEIDGQTLGKGSEAHKAAVVGDTVGDPFKDTSGPSINILMKLIAIVALVIAPLLSGGLTRADEVSPGASAPSEVVTDEGELVGDGAALPVPPAAADGAR